MDTNPYESPKVKLANLPPEQPDKICWHGRALRIGCVFAWLLYLATIALAITFFTYCLVGHADPRTLSSYYQTCVALFTIAGLFLGTGTAYVIAQNVKKQ